MERKRYWLKLVLEKAMTISMQEMVKTVIRSREEPEGKRECAANART